MSLAEKIIQHVNALPEIKQVEVLDFVEYLHLKMSQRKNMEWSDLSLGAAMRGMEEEPSSYTLSDLRESVK